MVNFYIIDSVNNVNQVYNENIVDRSNAKYDILDIFYLKKHFWIDKKDIQLLMNYNLNLTSISRYLVNLHKNGLIERKDEFGQILYKITNKGIMKVSQHKDNVLEKLKNE
jgi:predicted transcriptional regulator